MMKKKEDLYREELFLIEQIKKEIEGRNNFSDPFGYLIPLERGSKYSLRDHVERKKKLTQVLSNVKGLIRIEGEIRKVERKVTHLDRIMELIYEHTESKGDDQDNLLKEEIRKVLRKIKVPIVKVYKEKVVSLE